MIISYQKYGSSIVDRDLNLVAGYNGKIRYKSTDPKDIYKNVLDIYETYDEAVAILKKEAAQMQFKSGKFKILRSDGAVIIMPTSA